jgi:hypothetical protein
VSGEGIINEPRVNEFMFGTLVEYPPPLVVNLHRSLIITKLIKSLSEVIFR